MFLTWRSSVADEESQHRKELRPLRQPWLQDDQNKLDEFMNCICEGFRFRLKIHIAYLQQMQNRSQSQTEKKVADLIIKFHMVLLN